MPTDAQYRAEEVYNRARYDLIRRNQATLASINKLATDEALTVLDTGLDLTRYQYAGFMRQVLPPILDKWGNVSAKAALDHYEAARTEWLNVMEYRTIKNTTNAPTAQVVNGNVTVLSPGEVREVLQPRKEMGMRGTGRRQRTYAEKVTQGRIYQATIPPFKPDEMTDPVIAQAMKAYSSGGVRAGNDAAANALTRQIGAYNRDTALYNAGLDRSVSGVQRVVNPNGCAWCKTLAVGGIGRRGAKVLDFAVHFHDNCRCHIETLFAGDKPLRPDYYDDIEKDIEKARRGDYDDKGERKLREDAKTNITLRGQAQALRSVERSKGLGVAPTPSTVEIARKSISEASTGASVGEIVGKFFGDTPVTGFGNKNLELDKVKEVATTLINLKDKYPAARMDFINIKNFGSRSRSFAWVKSTIGRSMTEADVLKSTGMEINSNILSKDKIEDFEATYKRLVDKGFFTKVDTDKVSPWEYVVTHEWGHILDYSKDSYKEIQITPLKKAVSELKGLPYPSMDSARYMRTQTSEYGMTNNREYVAESFTDVTFNGENATELSRAIIDVLIERFNRVG